MPSTAEFQVLDRVLTTLMINTVARIDNVCAVRIAGYCNFVLENITTKS